MKATMELKTPLTPKEIKELTAGKFCLLTGEIYTARDKAHFKLSEMIEKKKNLPFDLEGAIIYYVGPTLPKKGDIIGSAGPTTSSRMDKYTPLLYEMGVKATIGKGERNKEVIKAMKKYKGIYFITWGGCGAYLKKFIHKAELIAFPELGTEAIYKLEVYRFPVIVAIDSYGKTIFKYS